jgi:hypothetical protein
VWQKCGRGIFVSRNLDSLHFHLFPIIHKLLNGEYEMADYIRKSTLCQAYVRVDKEFNLEDLENDNSELILEEFAKKRASFLLYKQVQTKVKFKKGSTISVLEM